MSAPQQGNGAEPAWVKAAADQSRLAFGLAVTELGRRDERVVAVSADTLDLIGLRGFIDHAPERVIDVGIAEQNAMGVAAGPRHHGASPLRLRLRALHLRAFHGAGAERGRLRRPARGDRGGGERGLARRLRRHPSRAGGPRADAELPQHDGAGAGRRPRGVARHARHRRDRRASVPPARRARAGAPGDAGRCAVPRRQGDVPRRRARTSPSSPAVPWCRRPWTPQRTLVKQGVGARVLNMSTIKPLDEDAILAAAEETRGIVTAEEHHLTGGLGGAVAEFLAVNRPTPMRMVGMPDEFAVVGPTDRIRARYGMSAAAHRGRLPRPHTLSAGYRSAPVSRCTAAVRRKAAARRRNDHRDQRFAKSPRVKCQVANFSSFALS